MEDDATLVGKMAGCAGRGVVHLLSAGFGECRHRDDGYALSGGFSTGAGRHLDCAARAERLELRVGRSGRGASVLGEDVGAALLLSLRGGLCGVSVVDRKGACAAVSAPASLEAAGGSRSGGERGGDGAYHLGGLPFPDRIAGDGGG